MRIGIVGTGAIGLTFAAALARTNEVVVLTRRAPAAELLRREGIIVERRPADTRGGAPENAGSDMPVTAHRAEVRATVSPSELGAADVVLVAVKAYATEAALTPLRQVLTPDVLVASVQNGIDNVAAARAALPGARIVAGSTTQGAIRLAEGRVLAVNDGTTIFGAERTARPSSDDVAAAFREAGLDAEITEEIEAVLWRKLVVNAAINPVCALAGRPNGAVTSDADLEAAARALAAEAASVASAEGFALADPWKHVRETARASAANRNSMLQDLDAGRPTEIEAISGAIVGRAATHRLAVPVTETVLHLVRARECAAAADRPRGVS